MKLVLPFPPASLSGHNTGHWKSRDRVIATYRAEAFHITRNAMRAHDWSCPDAGDIGLAIRFYPPNNLGDRTNYAIRVKAQIDGIAEALGVNDRRFLPSYAFCQPAKPGRVEVALYPPYPQGEQGANAFRDSHDSAKENDGPSVCSTTSEGPVQPAFRGAN